MATVATLQHLRISSNLTWLGFGSGSPLRATPRADWRSGKKRPLSRWAWDVSIRNFNNLKNLKNLGLGQKKLLKNPGLVKGKIDPTATCGPRLGSTSPFEDSKSHRTFVGFGRSLRVDGVARSAAGAAGAAGAASAAGDEANAGGTSYRWDEIGLVGFIQSPRFTLELLKPIERIDHVLTAFKPLAVAKAKCCVVRRSEWFDSSASHLHSVALSAKSLWRWTQDGSESPWHLASLVSSASSWRLRVPPPDRMTISICLWMKTRCLQVAIGISVFKSTKRIHNAWMGLKKL